VPLPVILANHSQHGRLMQQKSYHTGFDLQHWQFAALHPVFIYVQCLSVSVVLTNVFVTRSVEYSCLMSMICKLLSGWACKP